MCMQWRRDIGVRDICGRIGCIRFLDPLQAMGMLPGLSGDLATGGRLCCSHGDPDRLSILFQQDGKP